MSQADVLYRSRYLDLCRLFGLPRLEIEVVERAGHDLLNEVAHTRAAEAVASFVLAQSSTSAGVGA